MAAPFRHRSANPVLYHPLCRGGPLDGERRKDCPPGYSKNTIRYYGEAKPGRIEIEWTYSKQGSIE